MQEAEIKQAIADGDNAAQATAEGRDLSHYRAFDHVKESITEVMRQNLPYKCSQKVKRHLRRNCRKPFDMKVRVYASHLQRMGQSPSPNTTTSCIPWHITHHTCT